MPQGNEVDTRSPRRREDSEELELRCPSEVVNKKIESSLLRWTRSGAARKEWPPRL
eukprot:CAMPEP_0175835600 /NCGR_PEP_ID=MMETSP0107_2-20121207/16681_1 /TAXON_ID=195067 ORGANISM="Goniomonas pacifica, Strain CCMP1869" /NCGR_SAMPLE_ID=MMETSP0107_2 /ASSEMBLY_ACC=CAM_ASM_000203 /LENGTH=55 /DNA_ID=CAMNT_0017148909 /DNA_START=692 /DNA_END=859 /DNA_ORIENTATION=-